MADDTETYTCAACGETFAKARSDEEAMVQSEENFGEIPDEERVVICDDCYERLMTNARAAGWKPGDPT